LDFTVNPEANHSLKLDAKYSTNECYNTINSQLNLLLGGSKLDCILNVAGGWAGGNLLDSNLIDNVDLMLKQSVSTSVIAAKLASDHMKPFVIANSEVVYWFSLALQHRCTALPVWLHVYRS
jgi:dihydropteridine reductase